MVAVAGVRFLRLAFRFLDLFLFGLTESLSVSLSVCSVEIIRREETERIDKGEKRIDREEVRVERKLTSSGLRVTRRAVCSRATISVGEVNRHICC